MDDGIKTKIDRIEPLIAQIRTATDVATRDAALELVQILMEFHGTGIDRMMEIASEHGDAGWEIIESFSHDETVSNLLLLHGLHPLDLETRVRDALQKVRPYLRSHGGDVGLIEIACGVVRLQMTGSCNGVPSSSMTLKNAIEKAIRETAPDVIAIECATSPELVSIQTA